MQLYTKVAVVCLLFVIFVLILLCMQRPIIFSERYWIKVNKKKHKELHDILKHTKQIFLDNQVQYFLKSGTLLGSIRNQKFIPWDDDVDIGVTYDSSTTSKQQILEKYKAMFEDNEYLFCKEGGRSEPLMLRIFSKKNGKLWIDLFFLTKSNGKYIHVSKGKKRNKLLLNFIAKEWFEEKQLETLSMCELNNEEYPCPSEPLKYLNRLYGDIRIQKLTHVHHNPFHAKVIVYFVNLLKLDNRIK